MKRFTRAVVVAMAAAATAAAALADPLKIDAVMSPTEQIRLDFKDGSGHFMLMVRREGRSAGDGVLAGAAVTEYGRHDIVPGVGGDPSGYLVFSRPDGDTAYVRWSVRAVFIPGPGGKPALQDNGYWEVVSGTGAWKNLKGAGILHIRPASATQRRFLLEGETALQ